MKAKNSNVCIVGLGYVGLPLALLCAKKGFNVFGFDLNKRIVDLTNKGISHIADKKLETDLKKFKGKIFASTEAEKTIAKADIVIVCVPTPVNEKFRPDLKPLILASKTISEHLKAKQLIIIESTIYPGTVEEIVQPILEKSGLIAGTDFFLVHCPERINPGGKEWAPKGINLKIEKEKYCFENIARVLAGINVESAAKAKKFYESILDSSITVLDSVKAVEAVKMTENAFRDINIAFVNEMAKSFDKLGIDILEVITGASTKPFGFMPFFPGPGVGGHCIPVDPWYLVDKAKQNGFNHQFLPLARYINDSMPSYVIELLEQQLEKIGKKINGSRIALLGLAYKKDVDDTRESPALKILEILKQKNAIIKVFDPFLPQLSSEKSLENVLSNVDAVILATNHSVFESQITPLKLKQKKIRILIDARNAFDKKAFLSQNIFYKGIGR